jgi:SAM-dependent methyltransferase
VIGLDISPEMLVQAARKLAPHRHRVTLIRHSAVPLPFLDDTFEAVSCLEALEIMPYADQATAELVRVLKPGGVLLTTRGAETSGRTHAIRSVEAFTGLLESVGFERIDITPWWKNFDRVLAFKPGVAQPPRTRGLLEFLCCPRCGQPHIAGAGPHLLQCASCRAQLPVTAEGIIVG